jgi:hypothetical protein
MSMASKKAPPPVPPKRRQTVQANFEYKGEREGDLTFGRGDVIEVLSKGDGEWWRGRVNGVEGGLRE